MAAVGGTVPTFVEMVRQLDPDGSAADIALLLSQATPLVDDLPFYPSNLATAHRSTVQTGKPTVTRRRVNEPGSSSRGTTAQIVDGMAIYETRSTVDKLLVDLAPTPSAKAAVRMNAGAWHIQALGETVEDDVFYGSVADNDLAINGLTVRYDVLDGPTGANIIDARDTGGDDDGDDDFTSIWLLGLGPRTIYGVYPMGSMAGIMHHDDGLRDRTDPTGSVDVGGAAMLSYRDVWGWHAGLVVHDWRYAVRICNIDSAQLRNLTGSQAVTNHASNIIEMMGRAVDLLPNRNGIQPRFYMGRSTKHGFNAAARAMGYSNIWQPVQINGQNVEAFMGIPIRVSDKILYTEDAVAAA